MNRNLLLGLLVKYNQSDNKFEKEMFIYVAFKKHLY